MGSPSVPAAPDAGHGDTCFAPVAPRHPAAYSPGASSMCGSAAVCALMRWLNNAKQQGNAGQELSSSRYIRLVAPPRLCGQIFTPVPPPAQLKSRANAGGRRCFPRTRRNPAQPSCDKVTPAPRTLWLDELGFKRIKAQHHLGAAQAPSREPPGWWWASVGASRGF